MREIEREGERARERGRGSERGSERYERSFTYIHPRWFSLADFGSVTRKMPLPSRLSRHCDFLEKKTQLQLWKEENGKKIGNTRRSE